MDRYWYFRDRKFFNGDLAGQKERFLARAERREARKGDIIYSAGDPGDACYYVDSGLIRLFSVTDAGKDPVFFLRGPGEMLGMAEVINAYPRRASAQALVPTVLHRMPGHDLDALLSTDYAMARRVIAILGSRFRFLNDMTGSFAPGGALPRLVNLLVSLIYDQLPESGPWNRPVIVPFQMSADLAASITGFPRGTVIAMLAKLQAEGLLRVEDGRVTVVSPARLIARVEGMS